MVLTSLPGGRCNVRDLAVGHRGQPSQHVSKILKGIEPTAAAAFDQRVNDGAPASGIGFADEQPVLLVMPS